MIESARQRRAFVEPLRTHHHDVCQQTQRTQQVRQLDHLVRAELV